MPERGVVLEFAQRGVHVARDHLRAAAQHVEAGEASHVQLLAARHARQADDALAHPSLE